MGSVVTDESTPPAERTPCTRRAEGPANAAGQWNKVADQARSIQVGSPVWST